MPKAPLHIKTFRGTILDSESWVAGVVVDELGKTVLSYGDPSLKMSPRSTFKPFQAMPYLKSGAFVDEGRRLDRLALACSSHLGEDLHFQILEPWMQELRLSPQDLACGLQSGRPAHRLRNNCSGKHLGLLAASLKLGFETKSYNADQGPLQNMILEVLQTFFNEDFRKAGVGTDGCSLPVYDCQLVSLARAWGKLFFDPPSGFKDECLSIQKALAEHPLLVEGSDSVTSELIAKSQGDLIVKGGAAGVYVGVSKTKRRAFAFKCLDGQMDPTKAALFYYLRVEKMLPENLIHEIDQKSFGPPHNWAGETTGHREIL